jgi:SagB-type dehydrogenase family enzyme
MGRVGMGNKKLAKTGAGHCLTGGLNRVLCMVQSGGEVKMGRYYWYCLATLAILLVTLGGCPQPATTPAPSQEQAEVIKLPEPRHDSDVSLEQSLLERRSVRDYSGQPLTLQEISQLTWAAQGLTDPRGFRTAPSAGGLYPLELYLVAGDVEDLPPGVYRYQPDGHQLVKTGDGDKRAGLAEAALEQEWVEEGAVDFVFTTVYERTTGKYGERGIRYVHMEAGHAAQNLCLQATALGLGAVTIGAFYDEQVSRLLNLPADEQPLYVIPVGRK